MNATMRNNPLPDTIPEADEDQDEDVRLAMEMALAAAQNPGSTPDELRELVGKKNKQVSIVEQLKKDRERKAKEQAEKKWKDQKETMYSWISGAAASLAEGTNVIRAAAESLQSSAEQQIYADKIRQDPQYTDLRKKIKAVRKVLKTQRLAGNRVATRHRFKRHRMENILLTQEERIEKARKLFTDSNYQLQEYGKAIIRAGRKYKTNGTKEEENLEALLCRVMHQMLSIDKQKVKMRKSNKEMKKYLQRCKSWISDKQAFWEMSLSTLEASTDSMKALNEHTLAQQDKLIQKLNDCPDFQGVNLSDVDVSYFDELPKNAGPRGMLCALRGLPFSDSIRVSKSSGSSVKHKNGGRKDLYIEAASDNVSVSSALSDPDGDDIDFESTLSENYYGDDAPWNMGDASLSPSKQVTPPKGPSNSRKDGLTQPPSTISAPAIITVSEYKTAPTVLSSDKKPMSQDDDTDDTNEKSEEEEQPVPHGAEGSPISLDNDRDEGGEEAAQIEETEAPNDNPVVQMTHEDLTREGKSGTDTVETTVCSTASADD